MVRSGATDVRARAPFRARAFLFLSLLSLLALTAGGCATTDQSRLKEAREGFIQGDAVGAEGKLYSAEVIEHAESRLQHFMWLASVAMSQSQFQKALYYLERSRSLALELRSDRAGFDWFSADYKSNPIEFSYLHYFLVVSNLFLAEAGETPGWEIPEFRTKEGAVLIPAQKFPAHQFTPKEIADYRVKARAELLAWDQHLTVLKRTYPDRSAYQEDVLARILASYVHGSASSSAERRTAEILSSEARMALPRTLQGLSSMKDQVPVLESLLGRLMERAKQGERNEKIVALDVGVMPTYAIRKTVIGLSTLFKHIENPVLRQEIERVGLQVLFQFAPEFGMVTLLGALGGAASAAESEDAPRFVSEAADEGLGFLVQFPMIQEPKWTMTSRLRLTGIGGLGIKSEYPLVVLSPLQEILARELRERSEREWSAKAIVVGMEYLSILVPAVKAYQAADKEGNFLKKLAILAGYFLAKKAIDHANQPDLRSWSLLPRLILGNMISVAPGTYQAEVVIERDGKESRIPLGSVDFTKAGSGIFHRALGEVGLFDDSLKNEASSVTIPIE